MVIEFIQALPVIMKICIWIKFIINYDNSFVLEDLSDRFFPLFQRCEQFQLTMVADVVVVGYQLAIITKSKQSLETL